MVGTPSRTLVGRPYVPSAEVLAVVEEQVRDAKVIIFKKRRRKNSRRTAGHRQVRTRAFLTLHSQSDLAAPSADAAARSN